MTPFSFSNTDIEGLRLIHPFYAEDARGYFLKSFERDIFSANGVDTEIYEDFETYSRQGIVRGLHFQSKCPQAKYVRPIAGEIYDVAVDIRPESATFGKWLGFYLDAQRRDALYIPAGFAHGFLVLSGSALVSYKCAGKYLPDYDTGIRWDDETLAIAWPVQNIQSITVSSRDQALPSFAQYCKTIR